jgi:hypothetical protein
VGEKARSKTRYEEAVRLLREYSDARDQVNQLVGRAQVIVPGEPLARSGPPMDRDWIERWEKAKSGSKRANWPGADSFEASRTDKPAGSRNGQVSPGRRSVAAWGMAIGWRRLPLRRPPGSWHGAWLKRCVAAPALSTPDYPRLEPICIMRLRMRGGGNCSPFHGGSLHDTVARLPVAASGETDLG